jgi:acetylornithine deacetylase/succinyl-diaminopimelate desuccinylase-like protein
MNTEESEIAVKMLVDIIKFRTISGTASTDGSYNQCASWIQTNCSNIGLETEIIPESLDGKPIVVAKWIGANPDLPIIILNSHYDVVPGKKIRLFFNSMIIDPYYYSD